MSITYEDRKKVFDIMKILSRPEQEEIFRIIYKNKEKYTENSNGIFFDLSNITDEAFLNIKEYLDFCVKNRKDHEERLKELDILRNETYIDTEENTLT